MLILYFSDTAHNLSFFEGWLGLETIVQKYEML
jgi:hypothetical protein